jgi:hypothetical protein
MIVSARKREIAFPSYRTVILYGCNRRTEKSVEACIGGQWGWLAGYSDVLPALRFSAKFMGCESVVFVSCQLSVPQAVATDNGPRTTDYFI